MKALEELKRSGDITAYGMGINTGEALTGIASEVDLDFASSPCLTRCSTRRACITGMAECFRSAASR